jgi:hypothetical protein
MTLPAGSTDRGLPRTVRETVIGAAVTGLLFAWIAYRIWDGHEQLWEYGVDRPLIGVLAIGLSAATSFAYLVAAVWLRRGVPWSGTVITALAAFGTIGALYLVALGATHTAQIGFPALTLIVFGALGLAFALLCAGAVRRAEVRTWLARRSAG